MANTNGKTTRGQLMREEHERACKALTLCQLAVSDLAYRPKSVRWFRAGRDYRVGLVRPTSPSGGIVIVTFQPRGQHGSAAVYYLEEWAGDLRRRARSGNAESTALLQAASAAIAARDAAVAAQVRVVRGVAPAPGDAS